MIKSQVVMRLSCEGKLRHEVARLIVWQAVSTRPVVPSTVSYVVRQQGNALSNAHGHRTHSHPTGTRTARRRCICQHQAEMGRDGWYGAHSALRADSSTFTPCSGAGPWRA